MYFSFLLSMRFFDDIYRKYSLKENFITVDMDVLNFYIKKESLNIVMGKK